MAVRLALGSESGELMGRTRAYPRLRYMGSKYRIVPYLNMVLSGIKFDTVLDAFSGSGVVAYTLKELGKQVTANDFLNFASTIAKAVVENNSVTISATDIEAILSPQLRDYRFVRETFRGLYFSEQDHAFLDAAWSHIDDFPKYKRELAISALCLAAARKQPRGVFTITDVRYDDGRKNLHAPLAELFLKAVEDYNRAVFDNGRRNLAICSDVFALDPDGYDLVYFDPPYAPPRDDADYVKRYHFLEGLSAYWRGMRIMEDTKTKKIEKKYTPFAYKGTVREALGQLFHQFRKSVIVLSYSSNAALTGEDLHALLSQEKDDVQVYGVPHTYSFGTHGAARRRSVEEYIFVAR